MPAARGQSAEDGAASCVFVEVERLRIEFRRERLDALLADGDPARAVDLAHGEVLEIFFAHVSDLLCSGHISGPNHAPPATAAALMSPKAASARLCARKTDRKSTRLNSSHQIISYAVFCLKKKSSGTSDGCTSYTATA